MAHIKPPFETFARIKVVGIGGGGNNAVTRMVASRIYGVEFLAINTDAQDLHHTNAPKKLHIGKNVTRGLGAGMDPELGRQSAEESREDIQEAIRGADMLFITCGLGGGTGSGAGPIIAGLARDAGALTVGVVTKPFSFEGTQRSHIANDAWMKLRDEVDAIITIPNDRLLHLVDRKTPILDAFGIVDDILRQAVQGISDLITTPGLINLDFADVKAIMKDAGLALMGIGRASGNDRAINAARSAINSPLLDLSIAGASRVLFSISGGADLAMAEVHDAAKIITESIDPNAKVIFGAIQDERARRGEVKVTVIATGFSQDGEISTNAKAAQESPAATFVERQAAGERNTKEGGESAARMVDLNAESEFSESELELPAFIRKRWKRG